MNGGASTWGSQGDVILLPFVCFLLLWLWLPLWGRGGGMWTWNVSLSLKESGDWTIWQINFLTMAIAKGGKESCLIVQ